MIEEGEYHPGVYHCGNNKWGIWLCLFCGAVLPIEEYEIVLAEYDGGIWQARVCNECLPEDER